MKIYSNSVKSLSLPYEEKKSFVKNFRVIIYTVSIQIINIQLTSPYFVQTNICSLRFCNRSGQKCEIFHREEHIK